MSASSPVSASNPCLEGELRGIPGKKACVELSWAHGTLQVVVAGSDGRGTVLYKPDLRPQLQLVFLLPTVPVWPH